MRDVNAQAEPYKDSCNPLSSEAVKLAYSQPGALNDVQIFTSGEHTVTSGKVIARGNAIVHAMTDDVTVFALDHAVVDAHKNSTVAAYGHAHVRTEDGASVFAHEKSVVDAHGNGSLRVYDRASGSASDSVSVFDVHLKGKSDLHNITLGANTKLHDVLLFKHGENWIHSGEGEIHGDTTIVHADGAAKMLAFDESTTLLSNKAKVDGFDYARLVARDHAVVAGFQNTQIDAFDFSEIHGHDSPTIRAHGHAWVGGNDSAQIFAYDDTEIHARDSMGKFGGRVDAYGNATIMRDRYFDGPSNLAYSLHDQSKYEDRDADDKVIAIVRAGDTDK